MTQAEQLAAQAAQWQAAGRPDMAVQLYTAALDQDPSKFAIRMQLAECLIHLQQADQAAEQYLMVAQAYAARGRAQECLAICERIISIAPQSFVYMSVGPMIRRIGRHARPVCAKAAEIHLAAGRQTDGLQMLRLGAELDPHNPEVRRQLARIYQARHMKREAVEALSDAGNLLLQAKRYDDYVEVAQQVLALEPRDLDTLRDLPRVYLELRRPHEAVKALGELTKASPGDIIGYEILAQAFALIGRTDKSLAVLERLVEELGATGQADKANAILNHARYWRPTDIGFLHSLKRVEIPRPRTIPPVDPPPPAPEGTVVLSIADLVVEESRSGPNPSGEDSSVKLVEAEGMLMLDLDELLVDEMEQVMSQGSAPPRPPPPPTPRPAAREPENATITLDGAALMEALVELEGGGGAGEIDEDATTTPPGVPSRDQTEGQDATRALGPLDPSLIPDVLPSASPEELEPAVPEHTTRSISALVYDDEDDDSDGEDEPATMMHMRALTPEDIARAQRAAQAASAPSVDLDAPTMAPPGSAPPPAVDLDAPTMAPPGSAPPPAVDLDAPTMAPPGSGPPPMMHREELEELEDDLDGPTLGPMAPDTTFGGGSDEAPTMAKLTPLSAADIARALAKSKDRPSAPIPEPPSPPLPVMPPQPPAMLSQDEPPQWEAPPVATSTEPPEPPPMLPQDEPPQWSAPVPPPSARPEPASSQSSGQWVRPEPPSSQSGKWVRPEPPSSQSSGQWARPEPPSSQSGKWVRPEPPSSQSSGQWARPEPPSSQSGKWVRPEPPSSQSGKWVRPEPPSSQSSGQWVRPEQSASSQPSVADDAFDDEVTPLPGPLPSPPAAAPEQPPMLSPNAEAVPNDEEQMTRVHMHALTPEDIAAALEKQRKGGDD